MKLFAITTSTLHEVAVWDDATETSYEVTVNGAVTDTFSPGLGTDRQALAAAIARAKRIAKGIEADAAFMAGIAR